MKLKHPIEKVIYDHAYQLFHPYYKKITISKERFVDIWEEIHTFLISYYRIDFSLHLQGISTCYHPAEITINPLGQMVINESTTIDLFNIRNFSFSLCPRSFLMEFQLMRKESIQHEINIKLLPQNHEKLKAYFQWKIPYDAKSRVIAHTYGKHIPISKK